MSRNLVVTLHPWWWTWRGFTRLQKATAWAVDEYTCGQDVVPPIQGLEEMVSVKQ
jgi:hypothetical protein